MPHKLRQYELYITNEPATYNKFDGGINTNPSNEHLEDNEMRDCLNMHYQQGSLVKRKGAKLLSTILADEDLNKIQGVSLFTYKLTYLIVAADGKLYYGIYNPNTNIELNRLEIGIKSKTNNFLYDPTDMSQGLNVLYTEIKGPHDGYVLNNLNEKVIDYNDPIINSNVINNGEILLYANEYYRANKRVEINFIKPNKALYETLEDWTIKWKAYEVAANVPISERLNNEQLEIKYDKDIGSKIFWRPLKNDELTAAEKNKVSVWTDTALGYDKGTIVRYGTSTLESLPLSEQARYNQLTMEIYNIDSLQLPNLIIQRDHLTNLKRNYETIVDYNNLTNNTNLPYDSNPDWVTVNGSLITIQKQIDDLIEEKNNKIYEVENFTLVDYYECVIKHKTRITPDLEKDFIKLDFRTTLIFQNKEPIETATYNNRLYIATGTRFVEVYLNNLNNESTGKLIAQVVNPYLTNINENLLIGPNYMSPYPELARQTTYNQAITKIDLVLTFPYTRKVFVPTGVSTTSQNGIEVGRRLTYTEETKTIYVLSPVMTFANVENPNDYYFKWEKKIINTDGTVTWKVVKSFKDNLLSFESFYNIEVEDADQFQYRVTFAKAFKFNVDLENNTSTLVLENIIRENNKEDTDWVIDKAAADYYGQGTTIIYTPIGIHETYKMLHTCKKIVGDGNKFLLYDDAYNSGMWFKTVIDHPGYVTDRGMLSFKTNKNEAIIKVVPFAGAIVVFANSKDIGGSMHIIEGKGDDFEGDTYYSPYRRRTINESISTDNPNSVQTAENMMFFKYFDNIYYIRGGEISDEVISIYSINDRIKKESPEVKIPWNDNSCVSEITEDYYGLIWNAKYELEGDQLILIHPAMKLKLYYKVSYKIAEKFFMPWLRDESEYFNIKHIIYINGYPVYLYNNVLITFNEEVYTDFNKVYECKVHFRAVDLKYPQFYKLLSSVLVYYHRNQNSSIEFNIETKNEAGHLLLKSNKDSVQDIKNLKIGQVFNKERLKLDNTIVDSKLFNIDYRFPALLIDTIIGSKNDKDFTVASITYTYNTIDIPDTNPYDLYVNILRKKEL